MCQTEKDLTFRFLTLVGLGGSDSEPLRSPSISSSGFDLRPYFFLPYTNFGLTSLSVRDYTCHNNETGYSKNIAHQVIRQIRHWWYHPPKGPRERLEIEKKWFFEARNDFCHPRVSPASEAFAPRAAVSHRGRLTPCCQGLGRCWGRSSSRRRRTVAARKGQVLQMPFHRLPAQALGLLQSATRPFRG